MNSSDLALLKAYIPLKKYTDDIAADILYILNDRFDRYKKYLDEFPYIQMKAAISDLAPIVNRIDGCSNAFRGYMFTDFQRALFTGIDFGDSDISTIRCLTVQKGSELSQNMFQPFTSLKTILCFLFMIFLPPSYPKSLQIIASMTSCCTR